MTKLVREWNVWHASGGQESVYPCLRQAGEIGWSIHRFWKDIRTCSVITKLGDNVQRR